MLLALVSGVGLYLRISYSGITRVAPKAVVACVAAQRKINVCAEVLEPVCAKVNIQCIKAPCYPVNQTISNSCEACKNPLVESYTSGACAEK